MTKRSAGRRSRRSALAARRSAIAARRHTILRVLVAVAGFGVLVGGATVFPDGPASGADTSGAPIRVPVEEVRLACPESAYAKDATRTEVSAVAAPALPEGAPAQGQRAGALTLTELGKSKPLVREKDRERLARTVIAGKGRKPLLAAGTDALAPGATAGQLTRTTEGPSRGLSESECGTPGAEFWFVGAGGQVGQDSRLFLTNIDDAAAQLDIVLYDEKGPIRDDTTRSIEVGPREQRVVELDQYAPTSKFLAVQVQTTRGRIVAALRDGRVDSEGRSKGVDWIGPAAAPRRRQVIPGVASGSGARVLTVAAPGDSSAVVDVAVLGKNGTFQPTKNGRMQVPAGTVRQVAMQQATAGQASALQVTSDVPVTADVRSEFGGEGELKDFVHTAATGPLTGPAIVPLTRNAEDVRSSLLLSALSRDPARAEIVLVRPGGKQEPPIKVRVPAGGTVEKRLPTLQGEDRYTVIVKPVKGKLGGARLQVESTDDGPLASVWPLSTSRVSTVRPVTTADLGVPIGPR